MTRAMPRAELKVIENCGHIPHYERSAEVNPALLNFLSR
jgi:pimeloyl-ACP methyl ester carboxylesterase